MPKVELSLSDSEAGVLSVALQSYQMDAEGDGDGLRAWRIGQLVIKIDAARNVAWKQKKN